MNNNSSTNLVNFSNDIDIQCITSYSFFNINLLRLIEKHFGYKNSAVTIYNNNVYFDSVSINKVCDLSDYYKKIFHKEDTFSAHISSIYGAVNTINTRVIKSSDCFSNYTTCSYYKFLQTVDLKWACCMLFGNYRLTIYKETNEEDFSDSEIELFKLIVNMLSNRRKLYERLKDSSATLRIKNQLLDSMSIGSVTLNENYTPIEYNETAAHFLSAVMHFSNISSSIARLLELLSTGARQPVGRAGSQTITYQGYSVTIDKQFVPDENNFIEIYYAITITSPVQNKSMPEYIKKNLMSKYNLSPKEVEILEKIVEGNAYQQIADSLYISINTVRAHLKSIYKKLNVNNQRALYAIYNSILP